MEIRPTRSDLASTHRPGANIDAGRCRHPHRASPARAARHMGHRRPGDAAGAARISHSRNRSADAGLGHTHRICRYVATAGLRIRRPRVRATREGAVMHWPARAAYAAADRRLRERYRDEFEMLYREARTQFGLPAYLPPRGRPSRSIQSQDPVRLCTGPTCQGADRQQAKARGRWCDRCRAYQRQQNRKHRDRANPPPTQAPPKVNVHRAFLKRRWSNGVQWGSMEEARDRGYGLPQHIAFIPFTPKRGRPPSSELTYESAHRRVKNARGKASENPCSEGCGRPAVDWAYNHKDPDERIGRTGPNNRTEAPYSVDPSYYDPLCRSCHMRRDTRRENRALRARVAELEAMVNTLSRTS